MRRQTKRKPKKNPRSETHCHVLNQVTGQASTRPQDLELRNIPAKRARLEPIEQDEHPVPQRHLLRQIHRPPQRKRQCPREVELRLAGLDLRQRLRIPDVRQDPQRHELERLRDRALPRDIDDRRGLGALRQLAAHAVVLVEQPGEVRALLARDLRGGRERVRGGLGAVAQREDGGGAEDAEPVVDEEAGACVGLLRDGVEEGLDEGVDAVAGGPEGEAVVDGAAVLEGDGFGGDGGDAGAGDDVDAGGLEVVHGGLLEDGVELEEDVRAGLEEGGADAADEFGVVLGEVVGNEVVELGGELAAGGAAADDDEVEEAVALGLGDVGDVGALEAVHDADAESARIFDLL
mmetsp:Transcript_25658/g.64055  ORF Transcript_25658/g.64055 Transcript_25658/m.64055 type:complete len:348 (+) Transcript_25658:841-1884(+)